MIGTKERPEVFEMPNSYMDIMLDSFLDKDNMILKGGITLLGSRMGQGKTMTVNTLMNSIETTPELDWVQIAYLNERELASNDISFLDKAKELIAEYNSNTLLVVIDQIDNADSAKAGILLARSGYSVVGLTRVECPKGVSAVLEGAIKHAKTQGYYEGVLAANQLLEQLNLLVFQDENYPVVCSFLSFDKADSRILINELNKHGMENLLNVVIDKNPDIISKSWDSANWEDA